MAGAKANGPTAQQVKQAQPLGGSYQDQFGNPNAYAAATGMPASGYGQEKAWAGDMRNTMGGAPPPGFDEGQAGGTWESYQQNYADPYTAYYGSTGPTNVPGSGGWEPGTEGLPRGPNGNVDWSAVSGAQGDGTGTRQNDDSSMGGPGSMGGSANDFSNDALRQEQATFGRFRNLMDPVFGEQERAFTNQLAVQGLPTGGEAYNKAYDQFNRNRNNAYENAAYGAVGAGRQEQSRLFGHQTDFARLASQMLGQDAALQNQARQMGLNEAMMEREIPQRELAQLLGLTPATPYPQFQQGGGFGMQAPDIMGAMNSQANRQQSGQNAGMGTMGNLLAAWIGAGAPMPSSREWKDTVGVVDSDDAVKAVQSLPVERWRYKGDNKEHIGTYAEDHQRASGVGDGKMIEVVDALGLLTAAVKGLADRLDKLESSHG